jgi:site-specific DNA-cytosine methylase
MTASKKVCRIVRFRILFRFSSFSLLQQGPGKGDTPKRILPREGTRLQAPPTDQRFEGWPPGRVRQLPQIAWALHPLLVRGSKAGPSKGFQDRLRLLGLRVHY